MSLMAAIETDREPNRIVPSFGRPPAEPRVTGAETVRVRIKSYAILHTPREAAFDRLVFTTAQIFRVPIALVALVADSGFWLKAQVGLEVTELSTGSGLQSVVDQDDVLVVEDVARDTRFAGSSLVVGPPRCRFLAGAPLVTPDGLRIGCLCVLDRSPKPLLGKQVWQLAQMARSVVGALEARLPVSANPT
jgi:GAF domain-containing protein